MKGSAVVAIGVDCDNGARRRLPRMLRSRRKNETWRRILARLVTGAALNSSRLAGF
jgi:hypothetical protein